MVSLINCINIKHFYNLKELRFPKSIAYCINPRRYRELNSFVKAQNRLSGTLSKNLNEKLSPEEKEKLKANGWSMCSQREAVNKTFTFENFNEAFGFMTQVALRSEKLNHHPEWSNVYSKVDMTWTTHSAKGLTKKDLKMADFCDQVSRKICN